MRHGFIKAAAVTPNLKVADPVYNAGQICEKLREAYERRAKIRNYVSRAIPVRICFCRNFYYRRRWLH